MRGGPNRYPVNTYQLWFALSDPATEEALHHIALFQVCASGLG
jgi:hypothetical protein